jgi:glycosyltransferase involved in cell wall biosynthesis
MTIICLVINDLAQDQRMDRICTSLVRAGHEVTLVGRLLPSSKELPDKTYRQHRIHCRYEKGKLFYAEYNYRLIRELRSWHYDAICAVDLDTLLAGVRLTTSDRHKLVFDAHEWFSETPEVVKRPLIRGIWRGLAKALVPKSDVRYTVAPMLAEKLAEEYGVPFGTVRNLPVRRVSSVGPSPSTSPVPAAAPTSETPSTPPSLQRARAQSDYSSDNIGHSPKLTAPNHTLYRLVYQGMLNPGRGLKTVLAAIAYLPECELWLIGDGPEMEALQKCAEDFGITNRVWFAGFRPPTDLPALTERAWLGLNLLDAVSLSYYYSLANKAFDYVQAGLPSVQMAFPEYCALQEEYRCYALIDRLEPARLVAIIEHLIQTPEAYQKLVTASKRAAEELVWENEEAKLLEIWKSLC